MIDFITINELASMLEISPQATLRSLKGKINSGEIETKNKGTTNLIKFSTLPKEMQNRYWQAQRSAALHAEKIAIDPKKGGGFEKELWSAADKLRGNMDPSEYKYIVLGLLFLKYVSDAFYQQREKLKESMSDPNNKKFFIPNAAAREKMLDQREMYKGEGVFYIPEIARWEYLQSKAALPDVASHIESAMEAIEKENPDELNNVLPKNFIRMQLEPQIIGELLNIFSKINFDHDQQKERDTLGYVYEYFLGQFADAEGKRGGQFFTPRPLVKLLVEILEPFENSRVLDPAAGSGGMFVQASNFLKDHHKDKNKISIFGQESNETTLRLCKMNLAIRGVFGKIELGNTYYNDKFPDLKVDFCIANPPFNAEWDPERISEKDPRIAFGTPPSGNANFLWVQHFLHHLTPNGMTGFVMANGALAVGGKEGEIRKKVVEADLVDVIIACPPKLFYNVSLPVSLWFLTKNKETGRFRNRKGETLFIDARDTFEQISRKQIIFNDEQIQKIANTVRAWRGQKEAEEYNDTPGFCKSVNLEEIAKNNFVLTPGRYVGVPDEEDDGIPFSEKMQKLQDLLEVDFQKSAELTKTIRDIFKNFKS